MAINGAKVIEKQLEDLLRNANHSLGQQLGPNPQQVAQHSQSSKALK